MRSGKAPPSPWFISPNLSGYHNNHTQPAGTMVTDTVTLGATIDTGNASPAKPLSYWMVGLALGVTGALLLVTGFTALANPGHRRRA